MYRTLTPTGRNGNMNEVYLDSPASHENSRFVPLYCGFLLMAGLALFLFIACSPAAKDSQAQGSQVGVSALR